MKINVFELSGAFSAEQFLIVRFVNNFRVKKIILWDGNKK
jgi:hypothetical protein